MDLATAGEEISTRGPLKRQKEALVAVATYNVRTVAVKGKNGYDVDMTSAYWQRFNNLAPDFIDLQEGRRSTTFTACLLYTSPSPRD